MYKEITANKRKSVLMLIVFMLLTTGLSWLFTQFVGGDPALTVHVIIGSLVYVAISYFGASSVALSMNGAKPITKRQNARLYRIVENLSITEGLPMPDVYVIDDPAPNAFATGRNPNVAKVAVTSGLLEIMEDDELEGVLAHELGHIKNYDIRVSLLAFALVAVISLIADVMLRIRWLGSWDDDSRGNNQVLMAVGLVAALLAPFAAMLIQLAISRRREYLADATGALTTRYPDGLARALEKIGAHGSSLRRQNTSTAHLFFANPLRGRSIAHLFSTHPPIEERVKRLRGMIGNA